MVPGVRDSSVLTYPPQGRSAVEQLSGLQDKLEVASEAGAPMVMNLITWKLCCRQLMPAQFDTL